MSYYIDIKNYEQPEWSQMLSPTCWPLFAFHIRNLKLAGLSLTASPVDVVATKLSGKPNTCTPNYVNAYILIIHSIL